MPSQMRRRALLAIAVVLGLSALLAALAPTEREGGDAREEPPPAASPPREAGGRSQALVFDAARPRSHSISTGTRAALEVRVPAPGQVAIEGLGLNAPAEPGTPATFDVFAGRPGRYELTFSPIVGEPKSAGMLVVSGSR
jgi:hypothetical protein